MFYTSGMYIRPCYRDKNGKRHAYWVLVESMRTSRGPRQRVVAYVGLMEERQRLGVKQAAERRQDRQGQLFNDVEPEYVEIDSKRSSGLASVGPRTAIWGWMGFSGKLFSRDGSRFRGQRCVKCWC